MAESERRMATFEVRYDCDECGAGQMLPTGVCLASNPPQCPHRCDRCGHKQTFTNVTYPRIVYREEPS